MFPHYRLKIENSNLLPI